MKFNKLSSTVFILLIFLVSMVYGAEKNYNEKNIAKALESNTKSEPIVAYLVFDRLSVDANGNLKFDFMNSSKFSVKTDLDLRYINERLEKNKGIAHVVKFVLESKKPKVYKITSISNLQSADEYIEEIQRNSNQRNGLGFITDIEVKNQKAENEKKGFGKITDYQVINEKTRNAKLGFGFITDVELENQRIENEKKGFGKITDEQIKKQIETNKSAGLGELTDVQVENQKLENEKKGFGKLTDEQIKKQIETNKSAGLGELTDVQVENQKLENEKKGFGKLTDEQIKKQIETNKAAGLGEITDLQAMVQKKMNGFSGLGEISDLQVKNQIEKNRKSGKGDFTDFQIARREQLILDAKNYESKNQWIHALASYYDLMEENPTMDCLAAKESFEKIADAISNGKPGLGEYDEFEIYHSWKALCSEYENYWFEDCPLCFEFGDFKKGDLDYENRTATYSLDLTAQWTKKYLLIKQIVSDGYKKSYRTDWKGLSGVWPDTIRYEYYGDYEYIEERGCNYATIEKKFYEIQFSLIGKDGKIFRENLKCNPWNTVFINGVNKDWIKRFDEKEMTVCVNSIFINNKSGKYFDVVKDWWVQESFSQEVQDKIIKIRLPYQNKIENKNALGFTELVGFENQMKKINGGSYSYTVESGYGKNKKVETVTEHVDSFFMQSTEMTNEIFEALMEKDPEKYEKRKHPVVCSYVDAINFCNKLSEYYGRKPYYILGEKIDDRISSVTVDSSSNGFRLPTSTQWTFAASEGKMYNGFKYSGSNEIDEVAWYEENSRIRSGYDYKYETHEVGKKKPNAFGLYDMSGNEDEMVESSLDSVKTYGGSSSSSAYGCSVFEFHSDSYQLKGGFRVICPEL